MSTSGAVTSYYVDSLILPESEELSMPRYPSGPGYQHGRQHPPSIGEHGELGPCTFTSKPAVFGPSWSHVPAQFPGGVSSVYHHPYGHPQGPVGAESDARYQSWLLEPMSGSLPMSGLQASHHYGIKPEAAGSHAALLLSDYSNGSVQSGGEKEALAGRGVDVTGEGEEKPNLDPKREMAIPLCSLRHDGCHICPPIG